MNRRSASWVVRILLAVTAVAALSSPANAAVSAAGNPAASGALTTSTDEPIDADVPVDTANPFLPDERDVTDCVGLVERPGCGSESRGGLHQNLVAIAMLAGLSIVFGRIAWSIRRGQRRQQTSKQP